MSTAQPIIDSRSGTHFWVLSVDKPGRVSTTRSGTCTPASGSTRESVYRNIYLSVTDADPILRGATVLFFSLEPNRL
ncbi:hypothetical protein [Streptomyces doebereineriae]|uniref:Uncharacterized protein n=1 Tax=Streptomyces doebereineriae TaxID=3075528 RepID=A0ABU2V598_9ACTN|nr:hypothetical protein [Streptomyces sp. DSM 41640]MDT0480331.1 hypothetical protein [Streptomyces sp. DSM 41640]